MDNEKDIETSELQNVRAEFLREAITGLFLFVLVAFPLSVSRWPYTGFLPIYVLHILLFVWITFVFFKRKSLTPVVPGLTLLGVLGILSVGGILSYGLTTGGFLFLVIFGFMAGVSFGQRAAILTAGGSFLFLALAGFLFSQGILEPQPDPRQDPTSIMSWLTHIVVFGLAVVILFLPAARLQRRIISLAREKDEQSQNAMAASISKSAFLANMSHEIRTPMNGVVGMADILNRSQLNPEQKRMVRTIQVSSQSLLRIIDDILDLSKIEAGKMVVEYSPTNLLELAEGIVSALRPIAQAHNVRLLLEIDSNLPIMMTDPVRLRQIQMNLLNNAIKFSRGSSAEELGEVHLRIERAGVHNLRISVRDNGIGMAPAQIEELFKPFTQAESSTTREFGGTGLGLTIAKNLVDLLDGQIHVESEPGTGSTFSVLLPLEDAGEAAIPGDLSDLKVFALVDHQIDRDFIRNNIESAGAALLFAENEKELASMLASAPEGIIVLLALPSSDAVETAYNALSDGKGKARFLCLTHDLSARFDCILPDCFRVLRGPLLPSELVHGLAVLAGRASPDLDAWDPGRRAPEDIISEGRKILLVEDSLINQEVITTQINLIGYAVDVASNGEEGLEKWKTGAYDLILADCHMPVMDGFEMTRAIRTQEENHDLPRTPIIAITANALKGESEKCFAAGMDDFLSKPVALSLVREAIARFLE